MKLNRDEYRPYDAVNASFLKSILSHSYWYASKKIEPTPAMLFGTAAHTAILEPDEFMQEYRVFDGDRRTKAGKEEWNEIIGGGFEPLKHDQWTALTTMQHRIQNNLALTRYLLAKDRMTEASFDFESPYFPGMLCKSQIDLYGDKTLVDLKTIADITKAERQFFNMHYDLQMAFYQDCLIANGYECNAVKVLFIETQFPYQVALLDVTEEVLESGRRKIKEATNKMLEQRQFPEPEMITGELRLPSWEKERMIEDESPFSPVT